jgi:Zn-finger protein
MPDKICGALGCTNDAVGTVEYNGRTVWTCQECANREIEVKL